MISCSVGSHKDATITTTTRSTDETETTDGIEVKGMAVLQQVQQDENACGSEEFGEKLKRKRNLLDDVLLSGENELLPNKQLRYAIPEFNTGSWYAQDIIPIDPNLMNWSNSVTVKCI
jgi:hypothetical protein